MKLSTRTPALELLHRNNGRYWQILLQKSATVMARGCLGVGERVVILLFCEWGTREAHIDRIADMNWSRNTRIERWWRSGDQPNEPAKILRDRCQQELKLRTARPA